MPIFSLELAHLWSLRPRTLELRSTAAKITLADPTAIVARKQRRPCIESGGVATTHAVAARITSVIITRRVTPTCVRTIVAIVVIVVVPRRGGSGGYSRQQSLVGYSPPGLSTRNPGNPDWGRRSIDPRLGASDSQRNSAMFRPTERQQRHTCNGRGCDYNPFQNHFHGFLHRFTPLSNNAPVISLPGGAPASP
jgi:hypothetical protein